MFDDQIHKKVPYFKYDKSIAAMTMLIFAVSYFVAISTIDTDNRAVRPRIRGGRRVTP